MGMKEKGQRGLMLKLRFGDLEKRIMVGVGRGERWMTWDTGRSEEAFHVRECYESKGKEGGEYLGCPGMVWEKRGEGGRQCGGCRSEAEATP